MTLRKRIAMSLFLITSGLLLMAPRVMGEQASMYGGTDDLDGNLTASGEVFDSNQLTAASLTYPFGTRLLVKHGSRSVVVTVNDRGPAAWTGKDLDLTQAAGQKIGLDGVGEVEVSEVPSSASEKLPDTGGPTS